MGGGGGHIPISKQTIKFGGIEGGWGRGGEGIGRMGEEEVIPEEEEEENEEKYS